MLTYTNIYQVIFNLDSQAHRFPKWVTRNNLRLCTCKEVFSSEAEAEAFIYSFIDNFDELFNGNLCRGDFDVLSFSLEDRSLPSVDNTNNGNVQYGLPTARFAQRPNMPNLHASWDCNFLDHKLCIYNSGSKNMPDEISEEEKAKMSLQVLYKFFNHPYYNTFGSSVEYDFEKKITHRFNAKDNKPVKNLEVGSYNKKGLLDYCKDHMKFETKEDEEKAMADLKEKLGV